MANVLTLSTFSHTSPITIKRLSAIGIHTVYDLINYFPSRYEDYSLISKIVNLQEGEVVTIQGTVASFTNTYARSHMTIQRAVLDDGTGSVEVTWFNQPFLQRMLVQNFRVSLAGSVGRSKGRLNITPKEYELMDTPGFVPIHTARIVPVYPEKYGLSTRTIRDKVHQILTLYTLSDIVPEWLPENIVRQHALKSEIESYSQIHFPTTLQSIQSAKRRLAFDELFTITLKTEVIRAAWKSEHVAHSLQVDKSKIEAFIKNLPFTLTDAQRRVIDESIADLQKTSPMNRFIQGDVGSGKTVIAAVLAYATCLNNFQTLIMAPTEILARQHYQTISTLLKPYNIAVGIHTGSIKILKKTTGKHHVKTEDFQVLIGTHAILSEKITFDQVALVVVDEQHRFGVAQRAKLKEKGIDPHLLTMTATPIPRTIMLTLHGELDISVLDEMPKGRKQIQTFVVPPEKRIKGYEWIKTQIKTTGCQVFIICPLIDESQQETMSSMRAATKEYEYLKKSVFTDFSVGLLHGKLKSKEKDTIMREFKDKKYDILVATSVVEVGIDVPNATIMVIEGAERFGLAQLHQLRGRVGRGSLQSYCLVFSTEKSEGVNLRRLHFFAKTAQGMALSEYDLKLRGPGDIFGHKQHGYEELKIAALTDYPLIQEVKTAVKSFYPQYKPDLFPNVAARIEMLENDHVSRD